MIPSIGHRWVGRPAAIRSKRDLCKRTHTIFHSFVLFEMWKNLKMFEMKTICGRVKVRGMIGWVMGGRQIRGKKFSKDEMVDSTRWRRGGRNGLKVRKVLCFVYI